MKEQKNNNDVSLEWKNHEPFYYSLNKKMDEISEVGEECYVNTEMVYVYFAKVQNLFDKHFAYIQNPQEMRADLRRIQSALYKEEFIADQKTEVRAKAVMLNLFNRLRDIYTKMVVQFTHPGLIPTPIRKINEGYEEIASLKKKKMVKAAMGLFENV